MLKFAALALLAILPTQAVFADPSRTRSTADGLQFEYSRTVYADGILHLEGRDIGSGDSFHFAVAPNGRVTGFVEERAVAFRIGRKQGRQVAARIPAERAPGRLAAAGAGDATTGQ